MRRRIYNDNICVQSYQWERREATLDSAGERATAHCDAEILTFIEISFIYLRDLRWKLKVFLTQQFSGDFLFPEQ